MYLSEKKIKNLIKFREKSFEKFIKELGRIVHLIKGSDLIRFTQEYNLFKDIINTILNDANTIDRRIKEDEQIKFINNTNQLFNKSYLIVKGLEDLKALKNNTILLNQRPIERFTFFDIASYNNISLKKCGSAELEKTYICLSKLNLIEEYQKYLKIIQDFTKLKAHNPLVDAYYTWIIFNVFSIHNIN
jgi:hypothetical protein